MCREVLSKSDALAPAHPIVLGAKSVLGSVLCDRRELAEAEEVLCEVIVDGSAAYKSDQGVMDLLLFNTFIGSSALSDTAKICLAASSSLNIVLMLRGDFEDAERMQRFEDAERMQRRNLVTIESKIGSNHVYFCVQQKVLAGILAESGKLQEAEQLLWGVVQKQERFLGPNDLLTIAARAELALVLAKRGDELKAEDMLRRALWDHEDLLGAPHPASMKMRKELVALLYMRRKTKEAEEMFSILDRESQQSLLRVMPPSLLPMPRPGL